MNIQRPKISVAMAVYNGAKYLPEQLDSILPQLTDNDELVISYDSSSDTSLAVLQSYAEKHPIINIIEGPCEGPDANFNNALSHCTGDYIFLSDQDDKWSETKLSAVMSCFSSEHCDLVIHNAVDTDEKLKPESQAHFEKYRVSAGNLQALLKPRYSGCCMAFSSEMLGYILPIPRFRGYEQWIAEVCAICGRVCFLNDVLLLHRIHSDNVTPKGRRALHLVLKNRMIVSANLLKIRIKRAMRIKPFKQRPDKG